MSRIFLSHSSQDNFATAAVGDWLKAEGWDDVFLDLDPVQGIAPGERWERALYQHASDCEAVLFLVSQHWLASDWCRREYELARKLNKRPFIVLIEDLAIEALPAFLKDTHQAVRLGAGTDHIVFNPKMPVTHEEGCVTFSAEGLARLKTGLARAGLDPKFFAWPPTTEPNRAPYRGLEALETKDAGVFFGRDAPVIEALDALRGLSETPQPRLFVILGASGAGKSSFLRAGLLPRLARDDAKFLCLPPIRPERAAVTGANGLVAALTVATEKARFSKSRVQIREAVEDGKLQSLLKLLVKGAAERRIVFAIDQAEELFRVEGAAEGRWLLELLAELAKSNDPPVVLLFAIRSDSYDALQHAKPLAELLERPFSLPPMPRGAYQTVIERPAQRLEQGGRKFEIDPALTHALLEDVEQGGGDALPLLAFTLEHLYRDHVGAGRISVEDYRKFGGLKGVIDGALARVFLQADHDERIPKSNDARLAILRRGIIPWLAGVDPETKSPRRRVARAAQIPTEARPLIDLLVEQRLLTKDVDQASSEPTVEPAHEALLRQWGALKDWLDEDFALLTILEGVQRAARDWDANACAEPWLAHREARLAEAQKLDLRPDLAAKLDEVDRAYLVACVQRETEERAEIEVRRREREAEQARRLADAENLAATQLRVAVRTRIGMIAAIVLATLAGLAVLIASQQTKIANEKGEEALRQSAAAETARRDNFVSDARRVSALSQQFANLNQSGLALGASLAMAPNSADDPKPITASLEASLRRAVDLNVLPIARFMGDNVFTLALSPDGKLLAAGTAGDQQKGWVYVLDSTDLHEVLRFKASDDVVSSLEFSPDGDRLLAAGDKIPVVWSVSRRAKLFTLGRPEPRSFAKLARFSPDGKRILVGTAENRAFIHDGETGKLLFSLPGSPFEESIKRLKQANMSSYGVADPIVQAVAKNTFLMFGAATDVAFSPDGALAAVSGQANPDGSVRLYNAKTGALVRTLSGGAGDALAAPMGYGRTLWFTRDGRKVVAAPLSKTVKIWNVVSGALETEFDAFELESFALTPDDRAVVIGFRDGRVVTRCITGSTAAISFRGHDKEIEDVTIGAGGVIATASLDGSARLWALPSYSEVCDPRAHNNRPLERFQQPIATFWGLAGHDEALIAKDGKWLFTGSQDGYVRKFRVDAPRGAVELSTGSEDDNQFGNSAGSQIVISADSRLLFAKVDGRWSARSLENGRSIHVPFGVDSVAPGVGLSGPLLFSGPFDLVEKKTPKPETEDDIRFFQASDAFLPSPDGVTVVAPLQKDKKEDFEVGPRALFDRKTKAVLASIDQDEQKPDQIFYSADGKRLFAIVSSSLGDDEKKANGSMIIREAATGATIARFEHVADLNASDIVSVSRDGRRVVFSSSPNRIFNVPARVVEDVPAMLLRDSRAKPSAEILSPDGARLYAAFDDGSVRSVALDGEPALAVFYTKGVGVTSLAISPDQRYIAVLDKANMLWVFDCASRAAVRSSNWTRTVLRVEFTPDSTRIVVIFDDGRITVAPAAPTVPGLSEARDIADWARAVDLGSISDEDVQRYELAGRTIARSAKLEAIPAPSPPPRFFGSAPGPEAEECDKLAGDPFDRERRSGVPLMQVDANAARAICAEAIARYPEDLPSAYHLARVQERAGEFQVAVAGYRTLAEKGYAAAMREFAQLIDAKKADAASDQESAAQWRRKAAQAGDTVVLLDDAARTARDDPRPASVTRALGMLDAAGVKNRATAARAIYLRLARAARSEGESASALFYGFLSQELDRTVEDPAPADWARDRIDARELMHAARVELPPNLTLRAWRDARSWLDAMR